MIFVRNSFHPKCVLRQMSPKNWHQMDNLSLPLQRKKTSGKRGGIIILRQTTSSEFVSFIEV